MFGKKTDNLRCADYLFFIHRHSSFIYPPGKSAFLEGK